MKTVLWLDDVRDPFENGGTWVKTFSPIELTMGDLHTQVVWVKSYDEFTQWVSENGLPDAFCFDHDLGEDVAREKVSKGMSKRQARKEKKETKSGMDCAKWLVEYLLDNDLDLPPYNIQSANPTGKANIDSLLSNYIKFRESDQ